MFKEGNWGLVIANLLIGFKIAFEDLCVPSNPIPTKGKAYKNLDMIFAREDGHYIDPATFREHYQKKLKEAGLKHYTFHALRHTFATRALEAGIPIKVVSQILGHASVQITMDTYSHVLPELQKESMNRIAEYIAI